MNLEHLKTFLTLSQELSFTRAAELCELSQPSVSRQIKQLEEDLGLTLLIRKKHQLSLTAEGKALRVRLTPIFREIEENLRDTLERKKEMSGALSFGCLPEMGQHFFMPILNAFQNENPQIDFQIHYLEEDHLLERLKNGEIEFVILSQPLIAENVRTYPLNEEVSIMVTRKQNEKKLSSIRNAHFIGYHQRDPLLRRFLRKHYGIKELQSVERYSFVNSHRSMIDLLLAMDSYAVLPEFSVLPLINEGLLRQVSQKSIRSPLYLAFLEKNHESAKSIRFRKHLLEACRPQPLLS